MAFVEVQRPDVNKRHFTLTHPDTVVKDYQWFIFAGTAVFRDVHTHVEKKWVTRWLAGKVALLGA